MKLETFRGLETEHYFFHPDHLGSSNYITNFVGEVSQHSEYFAFGETFIEEHKDSHNSPYKFNGKELDEESGLYYYGARYYDPRISIWASVDPLANFNPFMDDEHYIDGDHNGGVFNHFNHNSYGYCYQNPVRLIDPNGKQVDAINGGVASGKNFVNDITPKVGREKMKIVSAIVLHRTVSPNAKGPLSNSKTKNGVPGFHLIIDKDGKTTQLVNLENRANHVGKTKGNVSNFNSIGIEVVGMPIDKNGSPTLDPKKIVGWEPLTEEQIESTKQAVETIKAKYNLKDSDIYNHEDVSWKTEGEGKTVSDAINKKKIEAQKIETETEKCD